jgi:molybdopterin converting factor subunit 1
VRITVKLFAVLRDRAGQSELLLDLPDDAPASAALEQLVNRFPSLSALLPRAACAVNRTYVPTDTILHDGDELALIPPVSGGSP